MTRVVLALVMLSSPTVLAAPTPAPVPPSKAAAPRPTPEPVPKARPRGDDATSNKPKLPAFLGLFGPPAFLKQVGLRGGPGRWAEFSGGALAAGGPSQRMRIAEVGPAPAGTRWFELSADLEEGQRIVFRMQFRGADDGNLKRLTLKGPMMPPMDFPVDDYEVIDRMAQASGHEHATPDANVSPMGRTLPADATVRKVGTEKVVVPAGTFECDHWIVEAEGMRHDYWTTSDPKVPFAGTVKMITEKGPAALLAVGTDAKTAMPESGARPR